VIGCLGQDAPGQQHRADEILLTGTPDFGQFRIPEPFVEGGVVGNQGVIADEVRNLGHHRPCRRRLAYHGAGDTGQLGDEPGHRHPGIHEALIAVEDLAITDEDRRDLRGPRPVIR